MGIIFYLGWPFIVILFALFLAAFIPTFLYAIFNLINGIKSHWQTKHIVGFIICGVISISLLFAATYLTIWLIVYFDGSNNQNGQSEQSITYIDGILYQLILKY